MSCQKGQIPHNKRVSDESLVEAYKRLGNVWLVAKEVRLCGQTVHERLTKLGVINKMNLWTEEDNNILLEEYDKYKYEGKLDDLAKKLNRTKQFICRKARNLGLTNRKHTYGETYKARCSKTSKEAIEKYGHPKGMLGKKHTEENKEKFRENSLKMWKDPNCRLNSQEYRQMISDRMSLLQSEGKLNNQYSRAHHGVFSIGGKEYFFRSAWEPNIAAYFQFLKEHNEIKEWEYEPITFWFEKIKRGVRSYKPDFRITRNDDSVYYVEVKGWMDDKSKTKLNRMRIYYPKVELELIDQQRYKEISKMHRMIPEWGAFEKGLQLEYVKCKCPDCENKCYSKGLCRKHYFKVFGKLLFDI